MGERRGCQHRWALRGPHSNDTSSPRPELEVPAPASDRGHFAAGLSGQDGSDPRGCSCLPDRPPLASAGCTALLWQKKRGSGDGDAVIKSERGLGAASGSRAGSQAASLRRSRRGIWDREPGGSHGIPSPRGEKSKEERSCEK